MASRHSIRIFVVGLCVTGMVMTLAAQQTGPRIAPRDQLTINVWGIEQLSGKFLVDSDGTFEFPHVGRLQAVGLTVRELEAVVRQSLVDGELLTDPPQVIIELLQTASHRVTVTGAVRVPGEVVFAGELKLFDALVKSGMTGPDAGDEILIVRPASQDSGSGELAEDTVLTIDLRELEGGNLAEYDIPLRDGDRIIVPEARKVFITGHVRSPGAYTVAANMNVRQVLALAGDITPTGSTRGIRIIRPQDDEGPKELKNVKLEDSVEPGDTIIIRKRIL